MASSTRKTRQSNSLISMFIILIIATFYLLIALKLMLGDEFIVVRYLHFLYSFAMLVSVGFFVYLLLRHRRKLLWFIPAMLFIVISYWQPLFPKNELQQAIAQDPQQTSQNNNQQFTLLSFSLNKSNHNYDDIATLLKNNPADIMCLQELPFDQYQTFTNTLKAHNIDMHHNYSKQGLLMLLSKKPLTPLKTLPYQQAKTNLGDQEVLIWNLHSPKSLHVKQYQTAYLDRLRSDISSNNHAHKVVCGDFNSTPHNDAMQSLFGFLTPAFHAANHKGLFTYPSPKSAFMSPFPFIKIDYLLFSSPFKVLSYERLSEYSHSDHYPIKSVISL